MADADRIIDPGPEVGEGGGRVVAQGPPDPVAKAQTHAGKVLAEFLKSRGAWK